MAVTKQQKSEIFNELVSKFKEAKSIWFTSTNKVTVEEFSELRKWLREVNATYTLAKKTIMVKAIKEALNIDVEIAHLEGQIWAICSNIDAVSGLGKVNSFMKEVNGKKNELGKMAWSISIFEWEVKSKEETKILASMPSRETLLSRLVGSMKSPISKLARFAQATAKEVEAQGKTKVGELVSKKEEASAE